eukprot:TRINITY_DN7465_c0_g1_i1.p1 TRINITY_DN7465_c0_g1~~TRINITY_DN7465_c0_g1_i1.p1  ORF type:complete len:232 (-),score=76.59 TRINITY_DN7465_c0_g1_i1:239-913(-)
MKSSGLLPEEAGAGASAALDSAVQDLEFRQYLLDRRPKAAAAPKPEAPMMRRSGAPATEDDNAANGADEWDHLLEDGDNADLERLRLQRLAQLKHEEESRAGYLAKGHGEYSEITEQEFLPTLNASALAACHFFHRDFERCKIMDMHLHTIASGLLPVRIVKMNAEKAGFFVGKLAIKVLPTVVYFKDGIAVGRQVGFDGLGGDEFATEDLLQRMQQILLGDEV